MKLKTILTTCTFLTTLAAAAAAQTAETVRPTMPTTGVTTPLATAGSEISVSGKVISSTSTDLVIETDAGTRMTFALDSKTNRATAFTNGERVNVQYHSLSGGTVFHAAKIGVETAPMAAPMPEPRFDEATATTPSRLPNTASSLPLIGLLGLLAAGGAVAVRVARQ